MVEQPCPCRVPGCVNADNDLCYEHYVHEPDEGAYRVCGECSHVYRTAEELLTEANRGCTEDGSMYAMAFAITDPEQVYSCPLCAHDF
jgi:hypothetical protein